MAIYSKTPRELEKVKNAPAVVDEAKYTTEPGREDRPVNWGIIEERREKRRREQGARDRAASRRDVLHAFSIFLLVIMLVGALFMAISIFAR